jgi:NAD(P)H-flavin reductase
LTAEKHQLPIYVSLNPIMIDGTGMCGGCRVTVDGTMKFACVDGPEYSRKHKLVIDVFQLSRYKISS